MSYLALARKYRPQTFEEVIGQEPIITTLRNSLERKRVHHAYLFAGTRGVGKTTTARLLARALNCAKGPTPTLCNECPSCTDSAAGPTMDILEIDGASSGGVDQIRDLRENVRYPPFRDRYKVVIIDEVHMVTSAGFNALLKTLEEPPAWIVFIFATTEYRKIPATILSRCQQFFFRPLRMPALVGHLRSICDREGVTISEKSLHRVAQLGAGSSRDSISMLDQLVAYCGTTVNDEDLGPILNVLSREAHERVARALAEADAESILREIQEVLDGGYDLNGFLRDFESYIRQLLIVKVAKDPAKVLDTFEEEVVSLRKVADLFPEDGDLLRHLQFLMQIEVNLRLVQNPRHLIEAGFLKMCHFHRLVPIEQALAKLDAARGA